MQPITKDQDTLTKAQATLCDTVVAEYDAVLDRLPKPKRKDVDAGLKLIYSLYDQATPTRVEVVDSPFAALALASALLGTPQTTTDWCGVADCSWVALYDYFHRVGCVTDDEAKDLLILRAFQRSVWDTVLLDECAIVVRYPTLLKRDVEGNLHSPTGPAIAWADGRKDWAWHGVWVPERVITNPKSYTKAEYEAITNTEVRRALGESAGWNFVVQLLGAEKLDTWVDHTTDLAYDLYATSTQRWLRKQSPALQNGKQPYYFEPVHEDLKSAQAARKWQAVPTMTPAECATDPTLTYTIET